MQVLFRRPNGAQSNQLEDFIDQPLDSLSFLDQDVEANETIVTESMGDELDVRRLLDVDDDYEEILYNS